MKKINTLQLFIALIVLVAMNSCTSSTTEDTSKKQTSSKNNVLSLSVKQVKTLGIQTEPLSKSSIGMSIFANGVIDVPPQNKSFISVPFGAYIREVKVLDGMRVSKGDVLLVVEHPEIIQLQANITPSLSAQGFPLETSLAPVPPAR